MGTSKEVVKAMASGRKGTEDQGKGPSGLTTTDKGKEKEIQERGDFTGGVESKLYNNQNCIRLFLGNGMSEVSKQISKGTDDLDQGAEVWVQVT